MNASLLRRALLCGTAADALSSNVLAHTTRQADKGIPQQRTALTNLGSSKMDSINKVQHRRMRHALRVKCPRCNASQIIFNLTPFIDSCGFEKYSIECKHCGASLVAIVDPADDKLLVTESIEE
jgi:ribosomal protein S27E